MPCGLPGSHGTVDAIRSNGVLHGSGAVLHTLYRSDFNIACFFLRRKRRQAFSFDATIGTGTVCMFFPERLKRPEKMNHFSKMPYWYRIENKSIPL